MGGGIELDADVSAESELPTPLLIRKNRFPGMSPQVQRGVRLPPESLQAWENPYSQLVEQSAGAGIYVPPSVQALDDGESS